MTSIPKIGASLTEMPPAWISRAVGQNTALGNHQQIRKMLGEPLPKVIDPNLLPPELKKFFKPNGLIPRLAKRLKKLTQKGVKKILPAKNTIASVDEDDNLYVGVDFLAAYGEDESLIAGILSHEWGHLVSPLPRGGNFNNLTWDDLFALRREEEANADGYAGRMLYLLGYTPEAMIDFLKQNDAKRKLPTHKYHDVVTRMEIVRQSYKAMREAVDSAQKILENSDVKVGRVLASG